MQGRNCSMAASVAPLYQPPSHNMLNLAVLLLFLIWSNALLADAKQLHQLENPAIWNRYLGSTDMPEFLRSRMSTMEQLQSHTKSLCDSAHLLCEPDFDFSNCSVVASFTTEAFNDKEQLFFQKSDILVGERIIFKRLQIPAPFRSFLPEKLASELPFGTKSLSSLLKMLSIPPHSMLAQGMKESMAICDEWRGDEKRHACAKSLEELVKFVAENLGPSLDILQSTIEGTLKGEDMTITEIALRGLENAIICIDLKLPSFVLDCSVAEDAQILEVRMVVEESFDEEKAVVYCKEEEEKRIFSSRREELENVMDMKMCNWLGVNELVFVSKKDNEKAMENENESDNFKEEEEEDDDDDEGSRAI